MRRSISILAAAVIAITGAATFAPAQAAMRAAPAVLDASAPNAGIVQVHRKKRYHKHRKNRVVYVLPHHYYAPVYRPRHYGYYHHPYGGYRSGPSVSFSFGFGGGGYHGW